MAKNKTVTTNDLTPGVEFYVEGTVTYSRLASLIDGEELKEKQRRYKNCPPRPHTHISLTNARVKCKDPQHQTPEEIYAAETILFVSMNRNTNQSEWRVNFDNKSKFLPRIFVQNDQNKKIYDEVRLEKELDKGLHVTLGFSAYKTQQNNGVRLDTVLVHEPLRYYSNDIVSKLEQMGLTVNSLPDEEPDDATPAETEAPATATAENPFSKPVANETPSAPSAPSPYADAYDVVGPGVVYNGDDKY